MHSKLSKPPVIYVLGQVRFSSIENIANYIPELQDRIRDIFPHFQKVNIQALQLREEGQQPITTVYNQWHFLDKNKQTGIILDGRSITLHTSQYNQFSTLRDHLEKTLILFNEVLKIALFTRVGLRYINFIEKNIDKIDKGLYGFLLKDEIFPKNKFLTKTETTQASEHGIIKIQSTHVGNKDVISGIKNVFVPPDLLDNANILFFPNRNEPENDFLILDLDHFNDQQGDFDVPEILLRTQELQEVLYLAFCNAVGPDLLKDWS